MNPACSGATLRESTHPEERILFFDADSGGQPAPRHNGHTNCVYLDGHGQMVKGVSAGLSSRTGMASPASGYGLVDKLRIAQNASADVWVKSIHIAIVSAESVVAGRGGFVLTSEMQAMTEPYTAQVVCRVPTDEVARAVNELGWVAQRSIRGEDLTRSYLDNTRTVALQGQRQERLVKVVDEAAQKAHVVTAEENLAGSESAEAAAQGELYGIAGRTTLATITVTLTQRDRDQELGVVPLSATARNALGALRATGVALARAAIWVLAFVWLWLPPVWLGVRAIRRLRWA